MLWDYYDHYYYSNKIVSWEKARVWGHVVTTLHQWAFNVEKWTVCGVMYDVQRESVGQRQLELTNPKD